MIYISSQTKKIIFGVASIALLGSPFFLSAETVTGGGYRVEQLIAPIQGALSGGGYVVQQSSQSNGGKIDGGGFTVFSTFGTSTVPPPSPPPPPPQNNGGTTGGGGGFYILPTSVTGQTPATSTPNTTSTSTKTKPTPEGTILTSNGSTCSTRIIFSSPIYIGSATNRVDDVKKL